MFVIRKLFMQPQRSFARFYVTYRKLLRSQNFLVCHASELRKFPISSIYFKYNKPHTRWLRYRLHFSMNIQIVIRKSECDVSSDN